MSDNFYNFTILTLWLFVLEIVTIFELLGSIFNSCNVFILISYTNRHATWASSLPHPSSHTGILSKYTLPWNKFKSCGIIWEFFSKLPTPKTMKNNENGWWNTNKKTTTNSAPTINEIKHVFGDLKISFWHSPWWVLRPCFLTSFLPGKAHLRSYICTSISGIYYDTNILPTYKLTLSFVMLLIFHWYSLTWNKNASSRIRSARLRSDFRKNFRIPEKF